MKIIKRTIILAFLLFLRVTLFCQEKNFSDSDFERQVLNPYIRSNDIFKEEIYVHFNKSCYLQGDNIWFSVYVIDPMTGLLNPYTKNLYVELYDPEGKLKGHKMLPVNEGRADNVFMLDEKAKPGRFVFRTYTNWMKNFYAAGENDTYLEVLGTENKEITFEQPEYDIQFFAESGTLLKGLFNRIGVKAVDQNGKAATLQGIIINRQTDSIASFKLNSAGLGELVLKPSENSDYQAKVNIDGRDRYFKLPAPENLGVILSVNSLLKNRITVEVKSNPETIVDEKPLYILLHNNGNIYKIFTAILTREKQSISFSFEKQAAGNGVNCLTVFNDDFIPVAERLFFNRKTEIKGKLEIEASTVNDSVQFDLLLPTDSSRHFSNLSVSVLPGATVSNKFRSSLLSSVLLKSGIRGTIENPGYFLEKDDPEHNKAMDLLLLTQGWRKYDWQKICGKTAGKEPKYPFSFEKGFTLSGAVKNWLNGKEDRSGAVSLISPENKILTFAALDSAGQFSFTGLNLIDSSRLVVSASSLKGKNWNRTIDARLEPDYRTDSLIRIVPWVNIKGKQPEKAETPLKLMSGEIQLPEFVVTAQEKPRPFEKSLFVSSFDRSVAITKENYNRYSSLETLLLTEFNVMLTIDYQGNYKADMGRGSKTTPPKLIIDDIVAPDLNYLSMYTIEQIEAVSVNKDGNAITGDGGAIILQTRKKAIDWGTAVSSSMKFFLVKGFAPYVEYYTPKYALSPETETYQKYASIFWKPDLYSDSTGISSFRFSVPAEVNVLDVRTEGISDDGTIYLDERKIKLNKQ